MQPVPSFEENDPRLDFLFVGESAKRVRSRRYSEKPIEVLPGHFSSDPQWLRFLDLLSRTLTQQLPAHVDKYGRVSENGVRSNFYTLRHLAGFPALPATYPVYDNSYLREQKGLSNKIVEQWHEWVFDAWLHLILDRIEPQKLTYSSTSSTMLTAGRGSCSKKKEDKEYIARQAMAHAPTVGKLLYNKKFRSAWELASFGGAAVAVYRNQNSDAITFEDGKWTPKKRMVYPLEYALSNGKSGEPIEAMKEPKGIHNRDGQPVKCPDGFFRVRFRTAYGVGWGTNAPIAPMAQAIRSAMYKRWPKTYHLTGRENLRENMSEVLHTLAADVSSHDLMFGIEMMRQRMRSVLDSRGVAEWFLPIVETALSLPVYVIAPGPDLPNRMIGDPDDPKFSGGLLSGSSLTDILGTWKMTSVYFIAMVEQTYPELIPTLKKSLPTTMRVLDDFLSWRLPICLEDKSDDALMNWKDRPDLVPRAIKWQEEMMEGKNHSPYMIISYEHGAKFLGNLLLYPRNYHFSDLSVIGDVNSMVANEFMHEYGCDSHLKDRRKARRPFPGLAWKTMSMVYGTAPAYSEIRSIVNHCYKKVFQEDYNAYRDALLRRDEELLLKYAQADVKMRGLTSLSLADHMALMKPDRIFYDPAVSEAASDAVKELFQYALPVEEVEPYFRSIFK